MNSAVSDMSKERYWKNPEYYRTYMRKYGKQWRGRNKDKVKEYHRRNNEKRRPYAREWSLKKRFTFLALFKFTCQYCGRKAPEVALEIDHIVPRAKGGTNDKKNLTVACRDCNQGKSDALLLG